MMDHEFRALSEEIDAYAERVKKDAQEGNLEIPIDSTSLLSFLDEYFKENQPELLVKHYHKNSEDIIEELLSFGVETLQQLHDLLEEQTAFRWTRRDGGRATYLGLLRDAMVITDARKYFASAWKGHWSVLSDDTKSYWKKHGANLEELNDIVHIEREDEETFELTPVANEVAG